MADCVGVHDYLCIWYVLHIDNPSLVKIRLPY